VLENLAETWRGVVDIQFRISGRETRPQMLQVAAPNEVVVLLGFDIRTGDARGMLNICVPAAAIEPLGAGVTQSWHRARREPTAHDRRQLCENLAHVRLPVSASLETTLSTRDLLRLRAGDVVSLGRSARSPLDVRVRGAMKFCGRLVASTESAAILLDHDPRKAPVSEA
jgi:flagellar motor switch protein FliM